MASCMFISFAFISCNSITMHISIACDTCIVIKLQDDQSEGLGRRAICSMIVTASGGILTRPQAYRTWDKTVFPYGQSLGLLTGYVLPQAGTSKRTAAGNVKLQRDWHIVMDNLFCEIRARAKFVLKCDHLVHLMMPALICNLDEECVHALGKNSKIAGSKTRNKHDNQNASSRFVGVLGILINEARPGRRSLDLRIE